MTSSDESAFPLAASSPSVDSPVMGLVKAESVPPESPALSVQEVRVLLVKESVPKSVGSPALANKSSGSGAEESF